jgi:hypothetical protein
MPAIRDLHGMWQGLGRRFAVSTATIAGDDRDRRMIREPSLSGRRLSIREKPDNLTLFQVADDARVSMIASPGPIIDADDPERGRRHTGVAPDNP